MADLHAALGRGDLAPPGGGGEAMDISALFRDRYPEMVRLANLLGADDPEDIAQEAFARLIRKHASLRDPAAALAYVPTSVCNLPRNSTRPPSLSRHPTPSPRHAVSHE